MLHAPCQSSFTATSVRYSDVGPLLIDQEGKRPSTQAGEFVREEMHHVREGKHGVRNTKQAIAIGRRARLSQGAIQSQAKDLATSFAGDFSGWAGKTLGAGRKRLLEQAKPELRKAFGRA